MLLVLLLVYVGLDLTLPMMPGAFEFEPEQCVDALGRTHRGVAVDAIVVPRPVHTSLLAVPPQEEAPRHLLAPEHAVALEHRFVASSQPRACCEAAAPPSEDPH